MIDEATLAEGERRAKLHAARHEAFMANDNPTPEQSRECDRAEQFLSAWLLDHSDALLSTARKAVRYREACEGLLEIAEQAVDTRTCSVGVLRAMNTARSALTGEDDK